jgi:hypothetical protein
MKKLIVFCFLAVLVTTGNAQKYSTAIGVKGGHPGYGSLSVKHFMSGPAAFEVNLGGSNNFVWLQGLYEKNTSIEENLEWYWALGADIGSWGNNKYRFKEKEYSGFYAGLDGLFGLEYTFDAIPINLALDFGPTLRIAPYFNVYFMGGFALRFAIK